MFPCCKVLKDKDFSSHFVWVIYATINQVEQQKSCPQEIVTFSGIVWAMLRSLSFESNFDVGFEFEPYCILRRVTSGGEMDRSGEVSPALFQNLKKSALILGKNALTRFIYGFNFSFKMLF